MKYKILRGDILNRISVGRSRRFNWLRTSFGILMLGYSGKMNFNTKIRKSLYFSSHRKGLFIEYTRLCLERRHISVHALLEFFIRMLYRPTQYCAWNLLEKLTVLHLFIPTFLWKPFVTCCLSKLLMQPVHYKCHCIPLAVYT